MPRKAFLCGRKSALCLQTVAGTELPCFLCRSGSQISNCHLASSVYGKHKNRRPFKKNKINQTLNLNCADINHSCNRLHLFIAFVCSATNLLDAPWRIHRLKNKNPYDIHALCPKCSTLLLKPLFIFRGNILAPFHSTIFFLLLISEVSSQPQGCVSAPALVACGPSNVSSSPSPARRRPGSSLMGSGMLGRGKWPLIYSWDQKKRTKVHLKKSKWGIFQRPRVTSQ